MWQPTARIYKKINRCCATGRVLRCVDIEVSKQFYELLGFVFEQEKHGSGPVQYAPETFGFVLDLYPVEKDGKPDNIRLGFTANLDLDTLSDNALVKIISKEESGYPAVILEDPDGRKVEGS